MVNVGYAQFNPVFGNRAANLKRIIELTQKEHSADLLVFPELASTGYDFVDVEEARAHAEPFGEGETSQCIQSLAAEHGTVIVSGYAELDEDTLYNSCILATPSGAIHNYRKIHLFSRETLLFSPGDAPPPVIETPAGRVGLMICFDWFFPETARLLALGGAQIIAHPSNLVLAHCQRAMYARSVENRVFTITANRFGTEDRAGRSLTFTGASQIVSSTGDYLVQAPETGEHIGLSEIDPHQADNKAINEYNDIILHRRTELYEDIL